MVTRPPTPLAVHSDEGGYSRSSGPKDLRRAHERRTELWKLQSTGQGRRNQQLCVAQISTWKPYLSGVLRAHHDHSALRFQGFPVFLARDRLVLVGDFYDGHFPLFAGTTDTDELYQVRMFFGQVRNETIDLRKRMIRRVEG